LFGTLFVCYLFDCDSFISLLVQMELYLFAQRPFSSLLVTDQTETPAEGCFIGIHYSGVQTPPRRRNAARRRLLTAAPVSLERLHLCCKGSCEFVESSHRAQLDRLTKP
jgi:hypothetical protein